MSGSFIQELKRRNVIRVAAIYVVVSWLLMQIGDVMFPALLLPYWTTTMLVTFLLLGFPVAMIFAWAYEITPDGVLRTEDVPEDQSITANTGQKINRMIIAVLGVVVVVLLVRGFLDEPGEAPTPIALASGQSIAVLPFKNQSAGAENAEFFAGGLHDELLTLLSKLGELKVISRTSVERLDPTLSIPEIGALLGVTTVLEGQVQRAGDRLRINVQLIDTSAEGHLWANTYDRELTAENIFDVQSDIARTISGALHTELSDSDEELLQDVPTASTKALERYLLGKQLWDRSSWSSLRSASDYFEEAVEIDPEFAQAWASLAGVKLQLLQTGAIDLQNYLDAAETAVGRALELNSTLSEAHAELGNLRWKMGDLAAAESAYDEALRLNSSLPWSLLAYGTYLRTTNRPAEAIPVLEKALVNDPLSSLIIFDLGKSEMYLGRVENTLAYARQNLEIDPSSVNGYSGNMQGYLTQGQYDKAMTWMIKLMTVDPVDFENWAYMAIWSELLGLPDVARKYMERAYELGPEEPVVLKCDLQIRSMRGDYAAASLIARRAIEARLDNRWYSNRVFLRQIRDDASTNDELAESSSLYRDRHPELFRATPEITVDNVYAAADLAALLQNLGQAERARAIIDTSLDWYDSTRPQGVYGWDTGIVKADLLILKGDNDAALKILQEAVDYGWNYSWIWYIGNPNFDPVRDLPEFQAIVKQLQDDMTAQRETYLALPDMGEFDLRN
jgi:TolB-like protein/tetratricopeptide (TPR) repeat protein